MRRVVIADCTRIEQNQLQRQLFTTPAWILCLLCGGKVLEFINPQLFEKSVNIGRGLMVSSACVLFRQVHKNPKIASAPAPANPRHTRLWLRENQTINNKPCERENTLALYQQPARENHYTLLTCWLFSSGKFGE